LKRGSVISPWIGFDAKMKTFMKTQFMKICRSSSALCLLACLSFHCPPLLRAQVGVEAWARRRITFTASPGEANNVVTDSAGNVIVTGFPATIKYSGAGMPLWTNYGGGLPRGRKAVVYVHWA
jgi:hypothetical protein